MDVLQNQILERKVLEVVQDQAKFNDQPYEPEPLDVEAIYLAAGGGDGAASIPEATEEEDETDSEAADS